MDAKEAIAAAKRYILDIYEDETISNLGLEEVEYDDPSGRWMVTLGFSRPFNSPRTPAQEIVERLNGGPSLKRMYKIVTLNDIGNVISMKNRESRELV